MEYIIKDYETRYFAGIELEGGIDLESDDRKKIPQLWNEFFNTYVPKIPAVKEPNKFIGLEMYPLDFMETKNFYYYAMIQTDKLIEGTEGIVTKKLPKGKYISFPVEFDRIIEEIGKVYDYLKKEKIQVHMGFDVEDYLVTQNYNDRGAILHMTFMLKE